MDKVFEEEKNNVSTQNNDNNDNVVYLFASKKTENTAGFQSVMEQNQASRERLKKMREENNAKVLKSYKLKKF